MKQQGIPKKERPKRPEPNPNYPTKSELTVQMIKKFVHTFPNIIVPAVLADALYGHANFMDQVQNCTSNAQVISQLRGNQLIKNRNGKFVAVQDYFARYSGVETSLIKRAS